MKSNTFTLDNESPVIDLKKIFFKVNLPSHKLMIEPGTVITIAKIGKDLYDILQKSKEKKKDNIGEWLSMLDRKLDKVLEELSTIKAQLRNLEEMIKNIHYDFAVQNMANNIRFYQMNISNLREFPHDVPTKNNFTRINSELQIDMLEIINHSAYHYLYDIILSFIIQFDLSYGLDNVSKHSKKMLIEEVKSFLEKAKDANVLGSFGQILQINKNSRDKLSADYKAYDEPRILRRWCVLERKKIGGGKGEPVEWAYKVARVLVSYNIQGAIGDAFVLTTENQGLKEERWVYPWEQMPDLNETGDQTSTRDRIHSDIHTNIFAPFLTASASFRELEKNVQHYQDILDDISGYLASLDELAQKVDGE